MRRVNIDPRPNWQHAVENHGLGFHTIDGEKYWDESACYEFSSAEIAVIGSWVIEGESCGIGIREDRNLVTTNLSRFIPHYFNNERNSTL